MIDQTIIETEVSPYLERAKGVSVSSQEERNMATEMIKAIKQKWKEIDQRLGLSDKKTEAKNAKKAADDEYNSVRNVFKEAEEVLREAICKFELEEETRRRMEAQQIEGSRLDKQTAQKEDLLRQAKEAEDRGEIELAGVLRDQANTVQVSPAFQEPEAPRAEGSSSKVVWKAKVIDPIAVCRLIAEGKLPVSIVEFRETELNKFAEMFPNQKFDGLQIFQDIKLTIRTN